MYTSHRREDVAQPNDEGIGRLLGFVLFLSRGRRPEQLTGDVHDRVVGGVLRRLGDADQRESGADRHRPVGAKRNDRQREEHAGDAEEAHQA